TGVVAFGVSLRICSSRAKPSMLRIMRSSTMASYTWLSAKRCACTLVPASCTSALRSLLRMLARRRRVDSSSSTMRMRCEAVSSLRATLYRYFSGLALVPPLHVAAAGGAVERAPGDEEQVRQAIEVAPRRVADALAPAQRHDAALGAPAHGARKMRRRRGPAAPGEDELLQRREA